MSHASKLKARKAKLKQTRCLTCSQFPQVAKELPAVLKAIDEAGWEGWKFLAEYLQDELGYGLKSNALQNHVRGCLGWEPHGS